MKEDRLNKTDNEEGTNPYYNMVINEFDKENVIASQME